MDGYTRVAAAGQVGDECAIRVEVDGVPICLARSQGRFFAINDVCSHADVSLAEGEVEDGTVECWLHGSRFDLATGEPTGLPATRPVATYAVKVDGDDVYVSAQETASTR